MSNMRERERERAERAERETYINLLKGPAGYQQQIGEEE